jgi:5'-3' exonuclease
MSTVIFGNDADLILLSLVAISKTNHRRLAVIREEHDDSIVTVDIQKLCSFMGNNQCIRDHIVAMMLFGNDFCPGLTCLHMDLHTFDELTSVSSGITSVHSDGRVILMDDVLLKIFNFIAKNETNYLKRKDRIFVQRFGGESLTDDWSKNLRSSYYNKLFLSNDIQFIRFSCRKFLESMIWTVDYYFNDVSHGLWYYPLNYAPLCVDLISFLNSTSLNTIREKLILRHQNTIRFDTDLHLLCITPPSVADSIILNPSHRRVMHGFMFPNDFQIQSYLKFVPWERVPILPHLNLRLLLRRIANSPPVCIESPDNERCEESCQIDHHVSCES